MKQKRGIMNHILLEKKCAYTKKIMKQIKKGAITPFQTFHQKMDYYIPIEKRVILY